MDTQVLQKARDSLKAQDYKAAERAFKTILDDIELHEKGYNIVLSSYGLTRVMNGDEDGLLLCRDAASNEKQDGDVFLNLAGAEWKSNNRMRAIDAVQHGLKVEPNHEQLGKACGKLECRKRCCISFLSRNNRLNRFLGRLRRRPNDGVLTVHNLLY